MADFTVKTKPLDPGVVAAILQRKQEIENQQDQQASNNYNDRMKRITDAITAGQQVASNMMTLAEKKNRLSGEKELTGLLQTPAPVAPTPMASSSALPQAGSFSVQPSPEQTLDYQNQTEMRRKNLMAALVKANPDDVTKELAKAQFSQEKPMTMDFQTKTVLYNNAPKEAIFSPKDGNFYDPISHERLEGAIKPYSLASPLAEQRIQNLRDRQTENLGKDLNDLSYNSNSPAGISAKRALYAKSGLNLIKQAEAQPGGVDKRQMAELQMEVARVLTGQGVITNEQINSLATSSAKSKIKNWQEWLTNDPTGLEQQKFVARFKETLKRQATFHGEELERNKQKAMAKYTTFEKQAPEEFYASLEQAGYNPKEYKKNRKLMKTFDDTPPELLEVQSQINSGRPSLDSFFK